MANTKKFAILTCLPILLLIAINFVAAANETETTTASVEQKAYDWLLNQSKNGNYENDVFSTSLAMLALNAVDYKWGVEEAANWLNTHKNAQSSCWPKTACKTKETAFAYWALKNGDQGNISSIEEWLKDAQKSGLTSGNWLLEVSPSTSPTFEGACKVLYADERENEKEKSVTVKNGRFPACGNVTFLDMEGSCLNLPLVPSTDLTIDCDGVTGSFFITIIYKSSNIYKIVKSENAKVMHITINNGCYGKSYKSSCDSESSFYVNLALKETESQFNTNMYLEEVYDSNKPLNSMVMYKLTKNAQYLESLKSRQKTDGSWNKKEYDTALAILALKDDSSYQQQVDKAVEWLKKQQKTDGSWASSVKDTALVLYAAFSTASIQLPGCNDAKKNQNERGVDCGGTCQATDDCCYNNQKDEEEEAVDCGGSYCSPCTAVSLCDTDGKCEPEVGETTANCPDDCEGFEGTCKNGVQDSKEEGVDCGGVCPTPCPEELCDNNGKCDVDEGEDYNSCPDDCEGYCGDDVCDSTETNEACATDCKETGSTTTTAECTKDEDCDAGEFCDSDGQCQTEEKSAFPIKTILVILVVVLIIFGGLLGYKKKFGGKAKPSQTRPDYKPFTSQLQKTSGQASQQRPSFQPEPAKKSRVEEELEKSLGEARKVLGKR
ncbi:hypothetical protein HY643_01475 [Candidatus Woesearchaeota archaeon]|nr:hypothetical protein [Candidatus Woesearchaeota archaeon]